MHGQRAFFINRLILSILCFDHMFWFVSNLPMVFLSLIVSNLPMVVLSLKRYRISLDKQILQNSS